jgi:hypothetical protein
MGLGVDERHEFIPAQTIAEASARILTLTGGSHGSRNSEKRVLVALRDALRLNLEVARTNAEMGEAIASELGIDWRREYQSNSRITLDGINALLNATSSERHQASLRKLASQRPASLTGPRWAGFEGAVSKIEAVNRISALTGSGPEELGPGSKERKSVLINLASNLAPHLETGLSKTRLGAALAFEFGAPWTPECESTGETISLLGLNTLLAGAERRLGQLGSASTILFGSPEEEGKMLANALVNAWSPERQPDGTRRVVWDGRKCIEWMYENGVSSGPHQNEWQGFYWESRALEILNANFRPNPNPPRIKYGNTTFDYSLNYVWDLKAHTEKWRLPSSGEETRSSGGSAPLNDQAAMECCIAEQGLGFLVASGIGVKDEDGSFVEWHRGYKKSHGVKSAASNSGKSRGRKRAFELISVDAYFFRNTEALDSARASGVLSGFAQGLQAPRIEGESGLERAAKYLLNTSKAKASPALVADFYWR